MHCIWFYLKIVLKMTVPDPVFLGLNVPMQFHSFLKISMAVIIRNSPHD